MTYEQAVAEAERLNTEQVRPGMVAEVCQVVLSDSENGWGIGWRTDGEY